MFWPLRRRRAAVEAISDHPEPPTVQNWSDGNSRVVVEQRPGYSCRVSMRTKVPLAPEKLWDVLTHPGNHSIFKGVKRTLSRRVVQLGPGPGQRVVDVEQEGHWRFLLFSGKFTTALRVTEDRRAGTIEFRQLRPGFMQKFEGKWTIAPFTQETLDGIYDVDHKHHWLKLRRAVAAFQQELGFRHPSASLATLEQSLLPAYPPPRPLEPLMKGIAAKVVTKIINDIQVAAVKINKGELVWPPPDDKD